MITRTEEPIAATTRVVEKTFCDHCKNPSGYDEHRRFNRNMVEIVMSEGDVYPEGGSLEKTEIDCCTNCFKDLVLPALIDLGFTPREHTVDI